MEHDAPGVVLAVTVARPPGATSDPDVIWTTPPTGAGCGCGKGAVVGAPTGNPG